MECGISPGIFWDSSINEILDMIEGHEKEKERERKRQLMDSFTTAKAIALNFSTALSGKDNFVNPWDFYADMFKEEKEHFEQVQREQELAKRREEKKKFIEEFNRRRQQGI